MALNTLPTPGRKPDRRLLWGVLAVAVLAGFFVADYFVPANVILSFLYSLALLAAVRTGSRRLLWAVAAASVCFTLANTILGAPVTPGAPRWVMLSNRGLTALALLAICAALDRSLVSLARRERAEAAQRESESRFRTIFEGAPIGMARVAFQGERWIEVNDTFCRMLGRTGQEMLSTPWTAMTHAEDLDLDLVPFRRMAAGELDRYVVEKRFLHKDGRPVWARLTLALVRDAEGRPDYEIAIMEDISDRKAQEEKLRASEARQGELLATLDLGASMARDPFDDAIRFWSAGCAHLYGWTADQALGQPAHELLRTVFPQPRAEITAALEREGEWSGDLRQRRRDGTEIVVSAHKLLRRDRDGRPVAVLESLADVTVQRRAEASLAESEARQGELLATLDLGASMARAPDDDTIRFWSAGCEHLYGWTAAEAVGRLAHELLHTVFPQPRAEIEATLDRDGEWTGDLRQRRRDGTEIVVSAHKLLQRDRDGRPVAVLESLADVTVQRHAEAALAESEARQSELLATLDLGASMARAPDDDTIRFWSAGCEHLYGWTAAEAVGRLAHELLQTVFPQPRTEIRAALEHDSEWTGDLRQRRKDGTEIIVSAHKFLQRDRDGRPVAVLESLADVTVQREAERVLARDKSELERLVDERSRELDEARARAAHAERLRALGQLAGGIAHDFNNVLQAVQGGVALIEKRAEGSEDIHRVAGMMAEAAVRGSAITRRLLAFSRRGDLRAEAVDPAALLGSMREVLGQTLGPGVAVRVEAPADLPPLLADKGQLETVLINLATNARDAMPEGGVLTFAAELETVGPGGDPETALTAGPYVRLSVSDTGTGMPPEMLTRVIEPFFTTKGEGQGTGLGLAMAKGFAEQSGGALHIESAPGRGTTVALWFPLAPVAALTAARSATELSVTTTSRRARLLLVDDEPIVRELTAEELREHGFTVVAVTSGPAALALLDAGEPVDLLVSDLGMPGMDGLVLIREAHRRREGLPAILLTGSVDAAAEQAAAVESVTVVRKPVTAEQLAEGVTMALQRADVARGRR